MSLLEIISKFDDEGCKCFDAHTIVAALSNIDESEKEKPDFGFENLAFSLVPASHSNNWGTYYGPQMTFTDDNGNIKEIPGLGDITVNAVQYWEQRYKVTKNPLLTMTYAGLVWDFKPKVVHQKYDQDLYRIYIDSMLKVCNDDYASHPTITVNILERLFDVAKKQEADIELVKNAYITFERRHSDDNSIRYWSSRFLTMLKNKRYFKQEEIEEIVLEHEQRLSRMSSPADNTINPWSIENQATILADYYLSAQQPENIKRVLNCIETALLHESQRMSKLQLLGNLENLHAKYRHYSLVEEAKRLSVKLQELGAETIDEMQSHRMEFTIPAEVQDQIETMFGASVGDDFKRLNNFALYFIPDKTSQQKSLEELVKKHPLRFLISNSFVDYKGRPMSVVGSYEKDPEGHLMLHVTQSIHLNSVFMSMAIQKMCDIGGLSAEKIMTTIIEPSPIFDRERDPVIKRSLELYFNGDFLVFCHLIIPQIENVICNIVTLSGSSVLRPQRSGIGFQLKTLDELLRDASISEVLTENGAYYLRLVLTDQRALNIRNLLCHGILPPESFDVHVANRLLHVLILLGLIRHKNIDDIKTT